jgi:NAD-dependent dihydropyrimidine dehydrogenase PreA subunit
MDTKKMMLDELQKVRTLRRLTIHLDVEKCKGTWQCYNVCPIGCWTPNRVTRKVLFHDPDLCIACGACVLQCPEDAIELTVPHK